MLTHIIWEFPKIGVPYFGGPYNNEATTEPLFSETPVYPWGSFRRCGEDFGMIADVEKHSPV